VKEAWWIIDQLVQQGVTQFCIAPGSRNAPLVLAAAEHPRVKTMVHFDERGVAFYALGFSKGAKKPAAILTTSGTAAGNTLPAVMEAYHSHTPLIILTADRPCELRDCGANQTTDQVKLFAGTICWQTDLIQGLTEQQTRSLAAQAVFHAQNGPVHLNCPFREPLHHSPVHLPQGTPLTFSFPKLVAEPFTTPVSRGLILLGAVPDPTPVLALAKRLQWPVFADLLSNARRTPTPEQIRHLPSSSPKSDLVLHFGERLLAKRLPHGPLVHISPHPQLQDPTRTLTTRVLSDIEPFCQTFTGATDPTWLPQWQTLDLPLLPLPLPIDRPLFFGNSMPIREAATRFFPATCGPLFANRGLSGIDGNIATAAGLSDGLNAPVLAYIGDQAALHDLNSLPLLHGRPVTLLISNNHGGAIFNHLPIASSPHLSKYFTNTHTWSFEAAAQMFDLPYQRWENRWGEFPPSGIVEQVIPCPSPSSFSMAF